eukprot:6553228-Prymnesium_polylepis.1
MRPSGESTRKTCDVPPRPSSSSFVYATPPTQYASRAAAPGVAATADGVNGTGAPRTAVGVGA